VPVRHARVNNARTLLAALCRKSPHGTLSSGSASPERSGAGLAADGS
jgi:hypothetical protein